MLVPLDSLRWRQEKMLLDGDSWLRTKDKSLRNDRYIGGGYQNLFLNHNILVDGRNMAHQLR